jgi:eukaryotic-like serine/threonine-protein kinase
MSESQFCPECGAGLPANAPGGLCPRCLMGAAVDQGESTGSYRSAGALGDRATLLGFPPTGSGSGQGTGSARPAAPPDLDRFKRAVLELGLIRDEEFDRFVAGALGGVQGLAKALVRAGKLTPYQAAALSQGKTRGLVIGNYFVLDKLGAGGMGVVFKAKHRRLGRVVALKILPPSLARDPDLFLRFRREVDVAARLSHPNIVPVLDADEDRGVPFMTMEYIEGNDLDRLVRDGGPMAVDQALDCVIQAARGLEAVHAQGIVHRDIKPGNLMLDGSGLVRVLDLGLARLIEASNPFGETADGALTKSGTYMGTVDFMAPEQGIDSSRVDHRADIYSLGCTLCYLLTGRPPFEGTNVLTRLMAHQDQAPSSLLARRPELSRAIDSAYREMMAKRPADRPASMGKVIRLLEACRSSNSDADEARSGLQRFAATVILKRAMPPGSTPGMSAFARDRPAADPIDPDLDFEHLIFDYQQEARLASPVEPTAVLKPELAPKRPSSAPPRKADRPSAPVLALGVLGLLVVVGLVYALFPKGPATPIDGPPTSGSKTPPAAELVASGPKGSPAGAGTSNRSPKASPAPRLASTFDVVTVYAMFTRYTDARNEVPVNPLAASQDGSRAMIGSWTCQAELVDANTASKSDTHLGPDDGDQGAWPYSMAMTPDGRFGIIGIHEITKGNLKRARVSREAGIVRFWDLTTGREFHSKQQPYDGAVNSVAISADGSRGLSGSRKGELTLWALKTGKDPRSLGPQKGAISPRGMAFFPDGRRAATVGHDQLVHIWDLDGGSELASWKGHIEGIEAVAISADGRRVVTGGHDGRVILWDVSSGSILHTFEMPPNDTGARVVFDSDGNIAAAGNGMDGSPFKPGHLIVWDPETFAEVRREEKPFARHLALAAISGGRFLTGDNYGLRLWTPRSTDAVANVRPAVANRDASPVNLLALIEPRTHKITGDWLKTADGALLSLAKPGWSRLRVPYALPPEYQIEMDVERVGKGESTTLGLYFPVGDRQAHIAIDRLIEKDLRCTGLVGYNGLPVSHAPKAHRGQLLVTSQRARLSLTVRLDSIKLICDGSVVMDWKGDPKRLIRSLTWHLPDSNELFLGTGCSYLIREMTLNPSTAENP